MIEILRFALESYQNFFILLFSYCLITFALVSIVSALKPINITYIQNATTENKKQDETVTEVDED